MKVNYVRLVLLTFSFICLYSTLNTSLAKVVWSEDFDDGDYEGWIGVKGDFSVENGSPIHCE